jgi:hypothetical protein
MLFLYKLPFKFLLICLNLICLYPIFGVIIIIITIFIKNLYYKEDIHRKDFFFPIIIFLSFSTLLDFVGTYLKSDEVAVILSVLKDNLFLIFMGYISVKDIVKDVFVRVCPKIFVFYMNDPNCSSSNGGNSPVENKPLIAASIGNTINLSFNGLGQGSSPYFERNLIPRTVLRNMWISENARNHKPLYERIQLDTIFPKNSKKNFNMGPSGHNLSIKPGENNHTHQTRLIGRMYEISRYRAQGLLLGAYPALCLDTKAFEKFYESRRGSFS